jgi:hypothetical protein
MRRSTYLATLSAALLLLASGALHAQALEPFSPFQPGAVAFAAMNATAEAGSTDLYLTGIADYGGTQLGFNINDGTSSVWGYQFYSPSLDSMYLAVIGYGGNSIFGTLGFASFYHSGTVPPVPLDTTGASRESALLAEKIRADGDYMSWANAHPDAATLNVAMTMPTGEWEYPLPQGFPTSEAMWVAQTGTVGDSLLICYLATESATFSCGQTFYLGTAYAAGISTTSNVTFGVTNWGIFGMNLLDQQTGPTGMFEAPSGSGNNYIYGAGLWFGARKRIAGELSPRVFITYDPNSGQSFATPGEGYDPRTSYSMPGLFSAGTHDRTTGESELSEFNWPLWVVSPDTGASLMSPGTFVGLNANRSIGDDRARPAFVPGAAEQYVSRYSDANLGNYAQTLDLSGFPLGLQIQENIFAQPGGFDHTVIVSYMIVNRSSDTLYDAVAGVVTDFDIGSATNDRTRFYDQRPDLRTAIAWTANESSSQPYGVLAMTLLEAPMTKDDGTVDESARAQFRLDGNVGTYQAWTIEEDPATSPERYAFMSAGDLDIDAGAGDYRGLLGTEPFTMLPGDTAHYAIAYIVNRDRFAITGADATLESRIENVINAYYGLQFSGVRTSESLTGGLSIAAAPNPATDAVALRMKVERAGDASIEVFDHLGTRVVLTELGELPAGTTTRVVDVSSLASGAYVLVATRGESRVAVPLVIAR